MPEPAVAVVPGRVGEAGGDATRWLPSRGSGWVGDGGESDGERVWTARCGSVCECAGGDGVYGMCTFLGCSLGDMDVADGR